MSLWLSPLYPSDAKDNPFRDIKLKPMSPEELEARIKKAQKDCEHKLQRFGSSYVGIRNGGYANFDESICMKCGYDPKEYK